MRAKNKEYLKYGRWRCKKKYKGKDYNWKELTELELKCYFKTNCTISMRAF